MLVGAHVRLDVVRCGRRDLLCERDSVHLARRHLVRRNVGSAIRFVLSVISAITTVRQVRRRVRDWRLWLLSCDAVAAPVTNTDATADLAAIFRANTATERAAVSTSDVASDSFAISTSDIFPNCIAISDSDVAPECTTVSSSDSSAKPRTLSRLRRRWPKLRLPALVARLGRRRLAGRDVRDAQPFRSDQLQRAGELDRRERDAW